VFLAKSAQLSENKRDARHCELRRVRKLLKTMDSDLRGLADRNCIVASEAGGQNSGRKEN
jgi:hypothetical protein